MTGFDKAIAAFIMPIVVFMAEAALSTGDPLAVLSDVNMWAVAVLTAIVVYAKGNANTLNTADPNKVREFLNGQGGMATIRTMIALVFGMLLVLMLAACDPDRPLSPLAIITGLGCASEINSRVAAGEFERGSPEWRTAGIACGLTIAQVEALEQEEANGT